MSIINVRYNENNRWKEKKWYKVRFNGMGKYRSVIKEVKDAKN